MTKPERPTISLPRPTKQHTVQLPQISTMHQFCLLTSFRPQFLPTHFFRIFVSTMQVLGDFWRKVTMTIHCYNLHHWRLGSYHILYPIRSGRATEAQQFHIHTPLFSLFYFKVVFRLRWKCRLILNHLGMTVLVKAQLR